eukprot:TRINITY_DN111997_c0_g1_i1.p1 TRINITY_DN111997_c0_g1~~TRINITY_DN111997_c0_g1_i1.p1  ORF type:complete len:255 (-),score=43.95 TRINITY_DN111997_c0_g1_i1:82-846(-)
MSDSVEMRMETMCLCMPLRLGILIVAAYTTACAILYIKDRKHYEAANRHYVGGYCLMTQVTNAVAEYSALFFGIVGMLGTWYCKRHYVMTFNMWQMARLITWLAVFMVDFPLLRNCEMWVNDVQAMTKAKGWNPTMYEIAVHSECASERTWFITCCTLSLLVFMYVIWGTSKYLEHMNKIPKHLLRVPKDLPSGSWQSKSAGERAALAGAPQGFAHMPMGQHPAGMMPPHVGMAPMGYGAMAGPVGPPVQAPLY